MQRKTIAKEEYAKRINIVIEYVNNNLDKEMNLNRLADISHFSTYHFHRIFRAMVGEPIGAFVVRMRIETAARLLRYSPLSVQEIAYSVGYNMPSSLTKVFKQFYAISPTDYRNNKKYTIMKPLQLSSDVELAAPKVVELLSGKGIYIRLQGDYRKLDYCETYKRLWSFVKENKLFTAGIQHLTIGHNDPTVTEVDKLRTDVCLLIHKDAIPKGEIGVRDIPGGKFLVFTYVGSYDNLYNIFDTIYRKYIPESGYNLRMVAGFEKYINNPETTSCDALKTEIYIPIE